MHNIVFRVPNNTRPTNTRARTRTSRIPARATMTGRFYSLIIHYFGREKPRRLAVVACRVFICNVDDNATYSRSTVESAVSGRNVVTVVGRTRRWLHTCTRAQSPRRNDNACVEFFFLYVNVFSILKFYSYINVQSVDIFFPPVHTSRLVVK